MPILYKDEKKGKILFGQWFRCTGCNYCAEICKQQCLEISSLQNKRLAYVPIIAKGHKCTFCRMCEHICPHQAIYVVEANNGE